MDVEIERPHVHGARTGRHFHDLILPIVALFVSFISIFIAWEHGKVMKELVHQNEKLVEAESLPYLDIYTSDLEDDRRTPAFRLTVRESGSGSSADRRSQHDRQGSAGCRLQYRGRRLLRAGRIIRDEPGHQAISRHPQW